MVKPFKREDLELMTGHWLKDLVNSYEKKSLRSYNKKEIPQKISVGDQKIALHDLRNNLGIILSNTELALYHKK